MSTPMPSWLANLGKKQPTAPASNGLTGGAMPTYNLPMNSGSFNLSGLEGLQPTNPGLIQGTSPQVPTQPYIGQPVGKVPNFNPLSTGLGGGLSTTSEMQPTQQFGSQNNPQSEQSGIIGGTGAISDTSSTGASNYSKTVQDITNSQHSGLPLGSIGMEGGYAGEMPTSEALRIEMLKDRAQGTGLYSIPKGQYATYDQILGVRAMADKHYSDLIGTASDVEKNKATAAKNKPTESISYSSPYMSALYDLGYFTGGTEDERTARQKHIAAMPEDQQKEMAITLAMKGASVGERDIFNKNRAASAVGTTIMNDFPNDMETNPYKYAGNKITSYIGNPGDKKYQDFTAKLGMMTAPIINNLYGVAVSSGENSRATQFIPDLATDNAQQVATKIKNLVAYTNWANDADIAARLAQPIPDINDYYKSKTGKPSKKTSTGGYAESWD